MDELLASGVALALSNYLRLHNPMEIRDTVVDRIENYNYQKSGVLDEFYLELAAIFRYFNHDNQLELLFDGRSHYDEFSKQWRYTWMQWIDTFSNQPTFLKAMLGATVFYPGNHGGTLISNRLKVFLNKHFNVKVYKYRGVMEFSVA
jgi:hypothetical protein